MDQDNQINESKINEPEGIENVFFDPLLDCLKLVCKLYGNPISKDELRAGLPLVDNRYTQQLFIRGAARAGLSARLVQRDFDQLDPILLPAVVMLRDGRAAVLVSINDEQASLIRPETGDGEQQVLLSELSDDYLGFVFYLKKQFKYDERAPETLELKHKHWFWGTLSRSWRIYRDVFIASFLISLFAIASPLFVMNVYDRVVPNNAIDTLWVLSAGISVIFLFDFILKQVRSYFIDLAGKKSDVLISAQIFEKVMSIRMAARPASVGAFAKHLQEFDHIREFITSASVTALIDLPFALIFFAVVFMVGDWLVFIPIGMIVVIVGYSFWIQGGLKRCVEESGRMSSMKNATLVEALTGLEMIKVCGAEGQLQARWEQASAHIADWGIKTRKLTTSAGSVASFCIQLTTVLLIVAGVYQINEGLLTMGGLIASVMLSSRALAPMAQLAQLATRYNQAKSALQMLGDIMELPVEAPDDKTFIHNESMKGKICFKRVSFTYPDQKNHAIQGISFEVTPGEKVGIIGRIGSGKSTIGRLATAFYDASEGQVLIDDVDIQQINPNHVRHMMGVVPQDITLFYGSLRDNLTLGVPWVDNDTVMRAAELAGVTEFSNKHPEGLDMHIAERGVNLSGGQRQSAVLARALLLNPSVMIMDEPTASMDNTTEARFRNRMKDIFVGKTVILITHKASMLDLVDRLIVVDQGKIVADGPKQSVQDALRSGRLHIDR